MTPDATGAPQRRRRGPLDWAALAIATGAGAGYAPIAPGTAGTIVAIPIYLLLEPLGPVAYLAATLALLAIGVIASERVAATLGVHDPGLVVVDEIVGFLVTMSLIEPGRGSILTGFVLFRCFDIAKPVWVKRMEALPGGLGIMLDDFVAGVLANVCLRILLLTAIF